MTKSEVLGIMGPPGTTESGDYRGGHYTVFFYLTHSMDFDESNTVRNGYTPLVFKSDRLIGIGKRDYRQAVDRPEAVGHARRQPALESNPMTGARKPGSQDRL